MSSLVYFIQSTTGGPVKIGTTMKLLKRLKALRALRSDPTLQVVGLLFGSYPEESSLHGRFSHLALGGEWFSPAPDLLGFISTSCRPLNPAIDFAEEGCPYSVVKIDSDILPLAKAVALLENKPLPEWLSDIVNDAAAKELNRKPIKRKPPKPRD